jgi:hypothetical protein
MNRIIIRSLLVGSAVAWTCGQAVAQPARPTIEELERRLANKEVVIADLLRRVQALEQERGVPPQAAPAPSTPPRAAAAPPSPPQAAAPAPGQISVNEVAAEHALERVLVQQGALLLPSGSIEVEPAFTYARTETSFPAIFDGSLASSQLRQNNYIGDVAVRAGLPWESQLEIDVPYRFLQLRTLNSVGLAGVSGQSLSGNGLGDVTATLSKNLLKEGTWRPNLIAGLQYGADTGGTVSGVNLGNGFSQLKAMVTATKRADPLAFVGSLGFGYGFASRGFDPGNEYDVSFGTVLATSPETSLRFQLQQRFLDNGERNRSTVFGSGQTQSAFVTGASVIVAPKILLDVSVGIGLTSDTPKYFFRIGLPIRLDDLWRS